MVETPEAKRRRTLERLRTDFEFYAPRALRIVNAQGKVVPFELKPPQIRLWRALDAQRAAGEPMRAGVLKARKVGFCLAPETRVLTADLRWLALDEIAVGAEIVAVDEKVPGGRGRGRKMRRAVVEAKCELRASRLRVVFADGREIVGTREHRLLSRKRGSSDTQWRTLGDLLVGDVVRTVTEPWGASSLDDAWMGGLLDGEGHLRAKRAGMEVTISQNEGVVLDRARAYLLKRGYAFGDRLDGREHRINEHSKLVLSRTNEIMRLLGQARPTRWAERSEWWDGRDLPGKRSGVAWVPVVSIEEIGDGRVIDLQTSTSTYIAEGFVSHNSTMAQGLMIMRATQTEFHHARVVAQDTETAGEVFEMGKGMWVRLPADIQPSLAYESNGQKKYMQFGDPSLLARRAGEVGLNSKITIDTEKSPSGGRGMTVRTLHLSEVAFWERVGKMLGLLNAVPDDEDTLILVESTAKGLNAFWQFWRACEQGNGFYPCFTPWFEENGYRRPFLNAEERDRFEDAIGQRLPGEISVGEDEEPALIELMRAKFQEWRIEGIHPRTELGEPGSAEEWTRILEALNWRRWAIKAKTESDVEKFHQEYPSTPEEAFLSTGRAAFDRAVTRRLKTRVEQVHTKAPPLEGTFYAAERRTVRTRIGTIDVPTVVGWKPKSALNAVERGRARWRLWMPLDGGVPAIADTARFVVGCDPESGEENEGRTAAHAIQVIDHATLRQVAEWESDMHDADEAAEQALLAALFFNRAWLAVEKTGGWGISWLRWLARDVKYPMVYRTQRRDVAIASDFDNSLGWSTDPATKPMMVARGRELLREGVDGIRSLGLVQEIFTYVIDDRGRFVPEPGERSDMLMAWLVAQMVAQEKRPRRETKSRQSSTRAGAVTRTTSG